MPNEVSALVEAAAEAVDRFVITPTQSLHGAVARRAYERAGPAAAPARLVHDHIASAAYSATRAAVRATAGAAAAGVRAAAGDADVRPLSASPGGRRTIAAMNGLYGDLLEERRSDLAIPMAVRRGEADVACDPDALRSAYPGATPRVAVFLHGLAETEEGWLRGASGRRGHGGAPFGERLHRDLGITPVDVRYNTGLNVSENGRRLSMLLESLVRAWPVAVDDLVLVGHSMGGLVARSACHAGAEAGHTWPSLVRHLVTLGTPHTGAPLEKAVHVVAWMLRALPETRPIADIVDLRSAGIRDLRFGYVLDDWRDEDPDALLDDRRRVAPPLAGATHTFITATVTPDPEHPLGWIVGDLFVRRHSAGGRHHERSVPVPPESVLHLGGLTHFDLLDHPLVYERVREVLRTG